MQQPRPGIHRWLWIAASWGACMFGSSAPAEEATTPLPQITVTAKVLERRIDTYIAKLSGGSVHSIDSPLARWRDPICPLVAGLPHKDGQFVFDRLSDDLESMDVPLGVEGCHPNFFIVATLTPEATLKAWWHRNFNLNGDQTGFTDFIGRPRPVRIWYNARLISGDGTTTNRFGLPTTNGTVFQGIESFTVSTVPYAEFAAVPDLKFVIAVIDLTSVSGMDWRQVTDYIAMAGATKVDLDARLDSAPTIMSLFSVAAEARPQSLSAWDRSFIKQLYHTDAVRRRQRVLIAKGMLSDVAAAR